MNVGTKWVEMLFFINSIMEPNYRTNIVPWPSNIIKTGVVRPILHRDKITIPEEFRGDAITLINANQNKGVHVFLEIAKRMPERRFLGVLPYYGELRVPPAPSNVEWIPFQDDIRDVLRRTRILLVPSYYESFGRVAMEAMINGIPVMYSKPNPNSVYPGGSTEGITSWIGDSAIPVDREVYDEWATRIRELDDEEVWTEWSTKAKAHVEAMDIFSEASRIAGLVETFSRENPVVIRTVEQQRQQQQVQQAPRPPPGPAGFGFSNGRLRLQR
jgi:glycosyltransferase involved in cell wall biosynthesis